MGMSKRMLCRSKTLCPSGARNIKKNDSRRQTGYESRQKGLRHPARRRRPNRLASANGLTPDHKERFRQTNKRDSDPIGGKTLRGFQAQDGAEDAGGNACHPHHTHDRRECAAIDGGTFHQNTDDLQIFQGPISVLHDATLHNKALVVKFIFLSCHGEHI